MLLRGSDILYGFDKSFFLVNSSCLNPWLRVTYCEHGCQLFKLTSLIELVMEGEL